MIEDFLNVILEFNKHNSWLVTYLSFLIAFSLGSMILIHIYKFAMGKNNWLGQPLLLNLGSQVENVKSRLVEVNQLNSELKQKLDIEEQNNINMANSIVNLKKCLDQKSTQLISSLKESAKSEKTLMNFYLIAKQIAYSLTHIDEFKTYRQEVYQNLFEHLIDGIYDSRENNVKVIIYIEDEQDNKVLKHYANSSGYSYRIYNFKPTIANNPVGKAWESNQIHCESDFQYSYDDFDIKENDTLIKPRSVLCIPIKGSKNTEDRLGVLCLTSTTVDFFTKQEQDWVELFSLIVYPILFVDIKIKGCQT